MGAALSPVRSRSGFSRVACAAALLVACFAASPSGAELRVTRHAFARGVEDKEPSGVGSVFPSTVGRLYFFTQVTGATTPTDILHVWLYDGREVSITPITVQNASWRTWSVQRIRPEERGDWVAEVRDVEGRVLLSASCRVE